MTGAGLEAAFLPPWDKEACREQPPSTKQKQQSATKKTAFVVVQALSGDKAKPCMLSERPNMAQLAHQSSGVVGGGFKNWDDKELASTVQQILK